MTDSDQIASVIYDAIDELNQQRPESAHLPKTLQTALFGNSGQLDSLALINLIVAVEDKFENEFGYSISLTEEWARSHQINPFRSVKTLIDYTCGLIEEKKIGV